MMRWSKILAIALVLYTVVVLGLLVYVVIVDFSGRLVSEDIYFIPVIAGTIVGAFIAFKRPENRMGLLMSVIAAALATLGASNVLVPWSLEQGNDTLVVIATHLSDLAWITQFETALVLLPLWFPTGRPINWRWARVGHVAIVAAVLSEVSFFLSETVCAYPSAASEECVTVANPWGIDGFTGWEPLMMVAFAMAIPAVVSTFVRWRRSDDVERRQIKWFFVAAVALLTAFAISFLDFGLTLTNVVFAMGLTAVWASIAIAVLKYRLGSQFESSLSVAASTLAVAALFNPLRKRVQDWVDRHFNRSAYDTKQVMDEFAGSLRDEVDTEEVVDGWGEVVEETMQPSSVGVRE